MIKEKAEGVLANTASVAVGSLVVSEIVAYRLKSSLRWGGDLVIGVVDKAQSRAKASEPDPSTTFIAGDGETLSDLVVTPDPSSNELKNQLKRPTLIGVEPSVVASHD